MALAGGVEGVEQREDGALIGGGEVGDLLEGPILLDRERDRPPISEGHSLLARPPDWWWTRPGLPTAQDHRLPIGLAGGMNLYGFAKRSRQGVCKRG